MRLAFLFLSAVFLFTKCPAQNVLHIKVEDALTSEPLPGANIAVKQTSIGVATNVKGFADLNGLSSGSVSFTVSFVGYRDTLVTVVIPFDDALLTILLQPAEEALSEVIVSSTRTHSRIEDLPLKVEVLGLEEMDEESTLVPGNIASILGDLAVITIQRTNPINGNDAIRMQGLDPQYTLMARDGLPLYGGFSGSLGVLSIPPLDLKQVEIIKGSVSTLYGGGAISGMINFLSKEPTVEPKRTLLLNYSTLNEKNLNTFFSGKISKRVGYTLVAGANLKSAVDVNKDGFTEIPKHDNFIIHPRFFYNDNQKTSLVLGLTVNIDNRKTGDKEAVKNGRSDVHPYLRTESSGRFGVDAEWTRRLTGKHLLSLKSAVSSFNRDLRYPYREFPDFYLNGRQVSSYTEFSDRLQTGKHTAVAGLNLITESFRKLAHSPALSLSDYTYLTFGLFIQDDWKIGDKFTIEGGLRYDHHNIKGNFVLPRIALFYKPSNRLSVRVASGAGYKTPNILALTDPTPYLLNNSSGVKATYSTGVNADINYHAVLLSEVELSLNQAFYYVDVKNPMQVITDTVSHTASLATQPFSVTSIGSDTYMQMVFKAFELYVGYNHTEALQRYPGVNIAMPFNPQDKFSATLAYSKAGRWRAGVEASFTANQVAYGSQYYYGGQTVLATKRVSNFWFIAAMVEKKFPLGSVVLNVENLTDARQAHHEKLVGGTVTSPVFKPIWGPLDGRVFNLSLKIDL